jgi:hypothetical protein
MKVLSLTEPCATLIKEKKKLVETRSFKTNYRGELYIHASSTAIPKEWREDSEFMDLVRDIPLNFGYIICKCKLADCIYMDEDFVNEIKKNSQEYTCGKYEVGRYAWILEDIEPLKQSIKAKGQLNIWDYHNEQQIMELIGNIQYGWLDKLNNKHYEVDNTYIDNYKLQSPKEVIRNSVGVCWDQVELERFYFKNNEMNIKTYFLVYYDNDRCPTHTFLTYEKNNKIYWFEHAWHKQSGIHEYNNLKDLLRDVRNNFIENELDNNFNKNNLCLFEYSKPEYGISAMTFYKHCESGVNVNIDNL